MAIELTPKGTRGTEFPKAARRIVGAMRGLSAAAYRLFGSRLQMQGVPSSCWKRSVPGPASVGGRSSRGSRTPGRGPGW